MRVDTYTIWRLIVHHDLWVPPMQVPITKAALRAAGVLHTRAYASRKKRRNAMRRMVRAIKVADPRLHAELMTKDARGFANS